MYSQGLGGTLTTHGPCEYTSPCVAPPCGYTGVLGLGSWALVRVGGGDELEEVDEELEVDVEAVLECVREVSV